MTNRPQILRSSTPGQVPAAGSRMPGELWTTFPDLQLGVIDASKNAQKLIAVRFFSTAANYAVGDFVIQAGVLYAAKAAVTAGAFNPTQWTQIAAPTDAGGPYLPVSAATATYLPLAGGTLTGLVTLSGPPTVPLHAATKAYADTMLPLVGGTMTGLVTLSGPPSNPLHAATKAYVDSGAFVPVGGGANTGLNDNRLINGDMRINQRGVTSGGTALGYTVDRWQVSGSLLGKVSWGQWNGASLSGFPYAVNVLSSSAYAVLAGDYFRIVQIIEGDAVSDFAWGTAQAQPVTLSFWVNSTLTGTFGGSIINVTGPRSYPFSYSVPVASTWTKIIITIPADTNVAAGPMVSGNGASVQVNFGLGAGATFSGPAGAWASANYNNTTGAVSVVGTNLAAFYVTGVKLEIGSVATPYNRQSLAKTMADCQRYYQTIAATIRMNMSGAGQSMYHTVSWAQMRASPTTALITAGSRSNANTITLGSGQPNSGSFSCSSVAAGDMYVFSDLWSLSAEL